jgi:hypothetical protein
MKLSEAIRLGATMSRQAFNGRVDDGNRCALAAASEACGIPFREYVESCGTHRGVDYPAVGNTFGEICFIEAECPECGLKRLFSGWPFLAIIYHLNDEHRWTREQIADFVELHEPLPIAEVETESQAITEAV